MDDKQIIKLENDIKDELKNYVKSVKEANKKEIQEKEWISKIRNLKK